MINVKSLQNFKDLLDQLEIEKIPFNRVENESIVRIPTHIGDQDAILYISWEPLPNVIQFIQILPCIVPQGQREALTSLLNRINFNIPVLGFVLNEKNGVLTFRTHVFLNKNKSILPGMIGALISITIQTAAKFLPQLQEAMTLEPETELSSLFDLK
jgi:hypothetical protein